MSGVEEVLGEAANYFDPENFSAALAEQFRALAAEPRVALAERGARLRARILANYTWSQQAERLAGFISMAQARFCPRSD